MSKTYLISDYHFGHANVLKFENNLRAKVLGVSDIEQHDTMLRDRTCSTLNKRDTLWILGDNGDTDTTVKLITECKAANIRYIPGNHDSFSHIETIGSIPKVKVTGITSKSGYWITHAPIHSMELRGKLNIHGHTHSKVLRNMNYVCVSIENNGGFPTWLEDIKEGRYYTWKNFL